VGRWPPVSADIQHSFPQYTVAVRMGESCDMSRTRRCAASAAAASASRTLHLQRSGASTCLWSGDAAKLPIFHPAVRASYILTASVLKLIGNNRFHCSPRTRRLSAIHRTSSAITCSNNWFPPISWIPQNIFVFASEAD